MNRQCFTAIELVFVIVIIGILSSIAIPRLIISRDDACYVALRTTLSETETYISREYTKKFLQGMPVNNNERLQFLKEIEKNNSSNGKCGFSVRSANTIVATVNKTNITMNIAIDSKTKFPTIKCDLSSEPCKRLLGRDKTK